MFRVITKNEDESKWEKSITQLSNIIGLLLKVGGLSIGFGLIVCIYYLKSIGFSSLISPTMTSGAGSGALGMGFGIGVFFILLFVLLIIIPLIVVFVKSTLLEGDNFEKQLFDKWLSSRKVFVLFLLFPLFFIVFSNLFGGNKFDEAIVVEVLLLFCSVVWGSYKDIDFKKIEIYFLTLILSMFSLLSLLPWILFFNVISQSWITNQDNPWLQYWLVFLIDMAYAFCIAFVVESFDERKDGLLNLLKPIFLAVLVMIIFLGCISPKVFLKGVMSFSGVRENFTDARWHYVEKSEYLKLPGKTNIHGVKVESDNYYFCSYSIFNYGDYNVLCPFDVLEGDAASCLIFESKKVRAILAPTAEAWSCRPPQKKRQEYKISS